MSPILELKDISKFFPIYGGLFRRQVGKIHAVSQVNLELHPGKTLGLVGESGCGKSTLARIVARLVDTDSGHIQFKGAQIERLSGRDLQPFRRKVQIVFQDPNSSLNPRMTVQELLLEPLHIHHAGLSALQKTSRCKDLLNLVGLSTEHLNRYPSEFSGGQKQRIGIARALAVEPEVLILDEPISALDVSIQAQTLNLLLDLQKSLQLSYLFISHDLRVVRYVSDQVAVMYMGQIVEMAKSQSLMDRPSHPYTKSLISAIPRIKKKENRIILKGEVPSAAHPPKGCRFNTRCPIADKECQQMEPLLQKRESGHLVSCLKV